MIALLIIGGWFGAGAIGAWIGARHWYGRFGTYDGCDGPASVTFLAGPIGLCGAALYAFLGGTHP